MRTRTLSNAIREKPNWWEQIKDPALVEKWTREALNQQKGERMIWQLTKRMVTISKSSPSTWDSPRLEADHVFQESHGYASVQDPDAEIEVEFRPLRLVSIYRRRAPRSDHANVSRGPIPSGLGDQLIATASSRKCSGCKERPAS